MLKKIGIPAIALLALLLMINPVPAHAGVRVGVAIGGGYPVIAGPAYPYAYGYAAPYYGYGYPAYGYAAPAYAYPYGGISLGFYGGHYGRGYYGGRYGYGYGYRGYHGAYRGGYRR